MDKNKISSELRAVECDIMNMFLHEKLSYDSARKLIEHLEKVQELLDQWRREKEN